MATSSFTDEARRVLDMFGLRVLLVRCRDYRRFANRHTGCHGVGCRVDMREYRIFPSGN